MGLLGEAMKQVLAVLIVALLVVTLPAQYALYRAGGKYYPYTIARGTSDSLTATGKMIYYQDKKFYFNSVNLSNKAVAYGGYSNLTFFGGSGTQDSVYFTIWMIDSYGMRNPASDSIHLGPYSVTTDTSLVRLDNASTIYHTQWGMKVRAKRMLARSQHTSASIANTLNVAVNYN
jgi:hypothetical protein